jgi:hypothetical protein
MRLLFAPDPITNAEIDAKIEKQPFYLRLTLTYLKAAFGSIGYVLQAIFAGIACGPANFQPILLALNSYRAVVGLFERFIGDAARDLLIPAGYSAHVLCPQQIPSTAEAQAAFLTNSISIDVLNCWTAANNDCPEPFSKILDSKRSREGVTELVQLRRRNVIDQQTYDERMRELGFVYDYQWQDYWKLSEQIPPVSELIRMMVRDVADVNLVNKFGMDTDFNNKWTGQLKEWGNNQGIGDTFAQYEWRAHWSIPSPGQLYEFYHRFRTLDPADPLYTDVATIRTALEQQDILPYWIDRFIAASFVPLTRRDAVGAYQVNAIDFQGLQDSLKQVGYTDKNALIIAEYRRRQIAISLRSNRITSLYRRSRINRATAEQWLKQDGYEQVVITQTLDRANDEFVADQKAKCVAALERRYMQGEFTNPDAVAALIGLGIDTGQADATVTQWGCVRLSKGKFASAAKLCAWFKRGLITQADYGERLVRLGWNANDVVDHIAECQEQIDEAKQKALEKKLKEQQRQQEKLQREQEKLAKEAAQAAAALARQNARIAKLSRQLQRELVRAAANLSKYTGADIEVAWAMVEQAYLDFANVGGLDDTNNVKAITDAVTAIYKGDWHNFPSVVRYTQQAMQAAQLLSTIDASLGL